MARRQAGFMFNEIEDVLRKLLIRELPVKNGDVSIEFDQPKREWSARLNRPTLNLFLYDLRENNFLRQPEWQVEKKNGVAVKKLSPIRLNLNYMITAWASEPEDEHNLLYRTLLVLFRYPDLPEDLLPETLKNQSLPIPMRVAEHDAFRNAADFWGVLDNELRPSIACTITLALNPYAEFSGPLVRSRDLRLGQSAGLPKAQALLPGGDQFWMVGGQIHSPKPVEGLKIFLVERGLTVQPSPEGRFVIGNLETGEYNLEITGAGIQPRRHKIKVPSGEYDLEVN
jgi:hypothetical protein